MKNSLLLRFFVMSVLIAGCSIAVTAWLASEATTRSIRQEQGERLATDATLYDELLDYAATHRDWADVKSTVDELARSTGRRIALTTRDRVPLADSGDGPLPANAKVTVDPLTVSQVLKPGTDEIDPRAVGPFALTDEEKQTLDLLADKRMTCLQGGKITHAPNGRPRIEGAQPKSECREDERFYEGFYEATTTERKASTDLVGRLRSCLQREHGDARFDLTWADVSSPDWFRSERLVQRPPEFLSCLTTARREQLRPFVAAPAELFITSPSAEPPSLDLSSAGVTRIALTALGILAVAGFAAWLTAQNLVRPIRALTSATRRMGAGDRAVRVDAECTATGELGELARSFNTMSERLADTERQRQAMVSDVAHELRTPLGNITGWLEATQDGIASPDPQLISLLLDESLVLQRLVDDLQDLAQADAGTLRLHPEPVVAGDVVDHVVAAHQSGAVTLTGHAEPALGLTADPVRLRQALGNLVTNAVRYTPAGGTVTVRARRAGDVVVFEVADTGVGIGPDDLSHVFDRFWRADRSRSRATGGSGLGLAITRHLVEAHGGAVSAESTPGVGSTFRITLPG